MKNVLIIHADQLRFNGLTINGAPRGLTPNIDRIAADGYNFTRHISANPICMPSRASLFTGLYPAGHGVWTNGVPLNRVCYSPPETRATQKHCPNDNPCVEPATMADVFKKAGYRTASFGKLHFTPNLAHPKFGFEESYEVWQTGKLDDWTGPYYGFDHVEFAQGHGEFPVTEGGHYALWLKRQAPDVFEKVMNGEKHADPIAKRDLYLSHVPSELHNSMWLARRFCEHLDEQDPDQPFFTFIGFPDPHHPFTPPFDALKAVEGMDLPPIDDPEGGTDSVPLQRARGKGPGLEAQPSVRDHVQRYTLAMIHLMDRAIGDILNKLEENGRMEDTIVVFTSDHGDFLGDHGLCYKNLYGCHSLLHVPFLLRVPGAGKCTEISNPMSNVDVLPTLASLTGVDLPERLHGRDIFQAGSDHLAFVYGFCGGWNNFSAYDERFRFTRYPEQDYVEMFDHADDPGEVRNVADDPAYRSIRGSLHDALLEANLRHHNPIVGRLCGF